MSEIKLTADSGGGTTSLKAPSTTTSNADVVLKLPVADGSSGQVLNTDGSGQLSFTTVSGTTINNNANNRLITGSGTANTLEGEANLTFDGDDLLLRSSTDGRRISFATDGTSHYMKYDNTLSGIILNGYGGIAFETFGTNERLRIDSSGRLLVGKNATKASDGENTAKAQIESTGNCMLDIAANGTTSSDYAGLNLIRSDGGSVNSHTAVDSGDRIGRINFIGADGSDRFNSCASIRAFAAADFSANNCPGHLTFLTNSGGAAPSERVRITSAGNVGIGTTSPQEILHVKAASETVSSRDGVIFGSTDSLAADKGLPLVWAAHIGTDADYGIASICGRKENSTSDNGAGYLQFSTGNAPGAIEERMRIRSNGTLKVRCNNGGTNSSTYNESTNWNSFSCNSSNGYDFKLINTNSSPAYTYSLELAAVANVNNTNYRHISCTRNSESTSRFAVFGNGNVQNTNNSYGSFSDVKLKENIVDAKSQWDDVKALRVRNFNFIDDDTKTKLLGLVAQEAETVCPALIEDIKDLTVNENGEKSETGTVTKELKYSILYMKAFKALQEAQVRIETLETKVAVLEGA